CQKVTLNPLFIQQQYHHGLMINQSEVHIDNDCRQSLSTCAPFFLKMFSTTDEISIGGLSPITSCKTSENTSLFLPFQSLPISLRVSLKLMNRYSAPDS
ncbi:hypothetical protein PENTCL1PPCAC_15514, partial [Pristionchus entomophagus]